MENALPVALIMIISMSMTKDNTSNNQYHDTCPDGWQRWKLVIEYFGDGFLGWQRQEHGMTVQEAMETAVKGFCGHDIPITVSGRTDTGVHALGQVAHMDLPHRDMSGEKLREAINAHLKIQGFAHRIAVLGATHAASDFHARFDAKQRHYLYRYLYRRPHAVIEHGRVWQIGRRLDTTAMAEAAQNLEGVHDFTSFRSSDCQAKNPVRTIDRCEIIQIDGFTGTEIHLRVSARAFLHHQIRNFAGTLFEVGIGRFTPESIKSILDARDRSTAGRTAPPDGLYFVRVDY